MSWLSCNINITMETRPKYLLFGAIELHCFVAIEHNRRAYPAPRNFCSRCFNYLYLCLNCEKYLIKVNQSKSVYLLTDSLT